MTLAHRTRRVLVSSLAAAALASCAPATRMGVSHARPAVDPAARREVEATYLRLPLRFEPAPNGPEGEPTFIAHGRGFTLKLSSTTVMFALQSEAEAPAIITMRLVGARAASATARRQLQGVTHSLRGRDRRAWRLAVPGYAEVESAGVYPGIDLVFYGDQRTFEYDFRVAPGADPSVIALQFDTEPRIDDDGSLVIGTAAGELVQHAPRLYQIVGGSRRHVDGAYTMRADGGVGFRVGPYDQQLPLVIDPVLTYSTFLGGSRQERGNDIAIDATGHMIITGETFSDDFPTASPAQPWRRGFGDVYVAKLTPVGSALVYATYLGGGGYDQARGVATDASGSAYIVGETFSMDFPATTSLNTAWPDSGDVFVAKLDATGSLVYSTLVGGDGEDNGTAIAVDASGRAHIAGATISGDFPTVNALQRALSGSPAFRSTDGTMTWTGVGSGLAAEGTRSFAFDRSTEPTTVYAGTEWQGVFKSVDGGTTWTRPANGNLPRVRVSSMAVGSGSPATLYAATGGGLFRSDDQGETWTDLQLGVPASSLVILPDEPSTIYAGAEWTSGDGVFRSADGGMTWNGTGLPGNVMMLAASGPTVYAVMSGGGLYRMIDGGSWTAVTGIPPEVYAFAVSQANPDVAYAGTFSGGLYTTSDGGVSWTEIASGVPIAAITIAPSDPATIYVFTSWWGTVVTHDGGITWESGGSFVTGSPYAFAVDAASPNTVFMSNSVAWDAFVATVSADGSTLERSTYLGGANVDLATGIALDSAGAAYVVGETYSEDFPVRHAVQPVGGGLYDIFVTKLSPAGAIEYATYLGGWGAEYGGRVAVDANGRAYVTGLTWSANFPVVNAVQAAPGGGYSDVFVSALSETGNSFIYSTYLGGSAMENDSSQSMGPDVAVTPSGEAFVTGSTMSGDFPITADAFQRTPSGGQTDGFITSFGAAGQVQYSTFIGASGADYPRGIAVDPDGSVVIAGWTDSADLPIVSGIQPAYGGSEDAFLARVIPGAPPETDTTPPRSEIALAGAAGLEGWYLSPVSVTVNALDNPGGRGVRAIEFSMNGAAFQPYIAPLTIATEGTTTIAARATDLANNRETPGPTAAVRLDSAAPQVTIGSPMGRDYVHTEKLSLSIAATDAVSGIADAPTVTLDGVQVPTATINLLNVPLGDHRLVATARDVAGHTSQTSVSFRIIATIDSLIQAVRIYEASGTISNGTFRALMAKLTDAKDAHARGNLDAARAKLRDFITQCTAASGNSISTATADALIADAQWVLERL